MACPPRRRRNSVSYLLRIVRCDTRSRMQGANDWLRSIRNISFRFGCIPSSDRTRNALRVSYIATKLWEYNGAMTASGNSEPSPFFWCYWSPLLGFMIDIFLENKRNHVARFDGMSAISLVQDSYQPFITFIPSDLWASKMPYVPSA